MVWHREHESPSDAALCEEQPRGDMLRRDVFGVVVQAKVFSTGILKISVVTDKRKYRIYRNFIGDRNKISEEI
jgi:hypothetical protein